MPTKQTTVSQRQSFYEQHQAGDSYEQIARRHGVSRECVRYWCRRQRRGGTAHSRYRRPAPGLLSRFEATVSQSLFEMRSAHPGWGPDRLRTKLSEQPELQGLKLPSRAEIGRYLRQFPQFRRRAKAKPVQINRPDPPTEVHECWQLDFKLKIELADGSLVHLHTVRDPVGEACIGANIFVAGQVGQACQGVKLAQVRTALRQCFTRWGTLPDIIQTDGDPVLCGRAGADFFPSLFRLWLIGLGLKHQVIRPGQPTDNAQVERCHRTVCEYAIVGNEHLPVEPLQQVLTEAVTELAFKLSSRAQGCAGQPPVSAHPELLQPRRPFQPEHELALFDLSRVDAYLATLSWERIVDKAGQVYLGQRRRYSLGRDYARQTVLIRFDPTDRHFVFYPAHDPERILARRPAKGLSVSDLTGLSEDPTALGPQQLPLPWPGAEGG